MVCLITGDSESVQRCHVIDKGKDNQNFRDSFTEIYGIEPKEGLEDMQNTVNLRSDLHGGAMDNLNQPQSLRIRRIVFDWLSRRCYIEDFYSGEISESDWVVGQTPNVKPEYFAYSNYRCSKRLKKYVRKNAEEASLLFDYRHWATD